MRPVSGTLVVSVLVVSLTLFSPLRSLVASIGLAPRPSPVLLPEDMATPAIGRVIDRAVSLELTSGDMRRRLVWVDGERLVWMSGAGQDDGTSPAVGSGHQPPLPPVTE